MSQIPIPIPWPVSLTDSPLTTYLVSDIFTRPQNYFPEKDCVASDAEDTSLAVTTTPHDSSSLLRCMLLEAITGKN
jgi:hypothetical protein